jgi:hypothetical protein
MTWTTVGEAFLDRELEKENRAGIPHYVIGQHRADLMGPPGEDGMTVAQLSWCGPLGACAVACVKPDGMEWELAMRIFRLLGVQMDLGSRQLPSDFELTEEMRAALAAAEERGWDGRDA